MQAIVVPVNAAIPAPPAASTAPSAGAPRLGDELVRLGLITADQLQLALQEQAATGRRLGELLVDLGFITQATLQDALTARIGVEMVDLAHATPHPDALQQVPKSLAQRHQCLPLQYDPDGPTLTVASANPGDLVALDALRAQVGVRTHIRWKLAAAAEIGAAIEQFYGYELSIDGILRELETGEVDLAALASAAQSSYSHPVVRLADAILTDAVLAGASDLHLEPEEAFIRLRYRIDGVLHQIRVLHKRYWNALLVRLKVMAGMNIAESRAPQDGRLSLTIAGRRVDFRAAVQPVVHGENFVLRVLDASKSLLPYEQLGLSDDQYRTLDLMLARPEGILLVTGPTGSGKTTTLYSLLGKINSTAVNIMTLEDPVEYPLPLMRQADLSQGIKMSFADGIRSMMRQDPDVILVGEIRDAETAEMAFRAAMTGHQVFGTLHTNSALRSFARLRNLGVHDDILAGNVIGFIGQRLVRRLCPHCRQPVTVTPGSPWHLTLGEAALGQTVYTANPGGCIRCRHVGYRGRMSIVELLRVDDALDALVQRGAALDEMEACARRSGFRTMAEDGFRRVLAGDTTLDEVGRVVDITPWLASSSPASAS